MSKHLIKIESTPHGVLGVRHAGLDQQYCEAGELVILKWQPDAGWGLQEAHYKDSDGNVTAIDLTRVKVDGVDVVAFVMPGKDITVGGTFKRFVLGDWTSKGTTNFGNVYTEGEIYSEGNIYSEGDVTAEGVIHVYGQNGIIFHTQDGDYSLTIDNGQVRVDPYNP